MCFKETHMRRTFVSCVSGLVAALALSMPTKATAGSHFLAGLSNLSKPQAAVQKVWGYRYGHAHSYEYCPPSHYYVEEYPVHTYSYRSYYRRHRGHHRRYRRQYYTHSYDYYSSPYYSYGYYRY